MINYTSVCLSSGHSSQVVRGAVGCGYIENTEAQKVVNRVAEILKQQGVSVKVYHDANKTQTANVNAIVNYHNKQSRQLDVSVHFNSSANATATGVEVLYYSNDMKALSAKVSKGISETLQIKDRGAKVRTDLGFLKRTNKPAILLEVCFISNKQDMDSYIENFEAMCQAIACAISGKEATKADNELYRLFSGTFTSKQSAENMKTKLLTLMKNVYVRDEGNGQYRIITGTFKGSLSAKNMVDKIRKKFNITFKVQKV